jgi:hypothetical protein
MFHRDLEITGVSQAHANVLWQLGTFKGTERARPSPCLAVLRDGYPVVVSNGLRRFDLPEGMGRITAQNIEEAAGRLRAKIVIAVEQDALRDIVETLQGRFGPGDDGFTLAEIAFGAIRRHLESSRLILYPDMFNFVFNLDAGRMRRFFDVVFPRKSSIVFYLFRGQSVESGLIIARGEELIETIAGHEAVKGDLKGFYPWQKGYISLLETVGKKIAPPSLGFFAELEDVRQILWYPEPGSFLGKFVAGRIVIDPMPAWVAAALGVDAVSRVARSSLELIRQFDTLGITRRFDLGSFGRAFQERLRKEEISIEGILGFDPISLLSRTIDWLAK